MKTLFAFALIIACGVLILLATVDLEPYLVSGDTTVNESSKTSDALKIDTGNGGGPSSATPPIPVKTFTTDQGPSIEKSLEAQQQTAGLPQPSGDSIDQLVARHETAEVHTREQALTATTEHHSESTSKDLPTDITLTNLPDGEYPYSILLETFDEKATALQAISIYLNRGIPSHWVQVDLGEKGVKYRLFTGFFQTEKQASAFLKRAKLGDKLVKKTEYAALIGSFKEETELNPVIAKIDSDDVRTYAISNQLGDLLLYAGAFYTLAGATEQCAQLLDMGVPCKPVRRSTHPD